MRVCCIRCVSCHIQKICSVISVSNGPSIVPKLKEMKEKLDSHRKLEQARKCYNMLIIASNWWHINTFSHFPWLSTQQFSDLLEMVYSDSNPKPSSTRCEERPTLASHPSGHDLWCEVTWGHLISTLQEWAYHLQGLKVRKSTVLHVLFPSFCRSCSVSLAMCVSIWTCRHHQSPCKLQVCLDVTCETSHLLNVVSKKFVRFLELLFWNREISLKHDVVTFS